MCFGVWTWIWNHILNLFMQHTSLGYGNVDDLLVVAVVQPQPGYYGSSSAQLKNLIMEIADIYNRLLSKAVSIES
jgi:hypothetical protein